MNAPGGFFCRARFVFRILFFRSGLWRVAAPVCGAPLFRPMPRRHPRSASVAVPVCAVSPLSPCAVPLFRPVPCRHPRPASVAVPVCALSPLSPCAVPLFRPVPCRHPRPASVAVPVCALSPLRFASHCHPLSASCRRSGLRMAAAGEFCGRFGGESVRAVGLLRPFPALRRFRSGRPPAFL